MLQFATTLVTWQSGREHVARALAVNVGRFSQGCGKTTKKILVKKEMFLSPAFITMCLLLSSLSLSLLPKETASSCDAELLSLLLDAGLLVGCVSSALYPLLSSHMLSQQQEGGWDVEKAASELLAAGHGPQAGSLLLAHRGTHQVQFTFNSALAVLRKWL